ncbi:MAG: hypothetical protein ACPG7F_02110 [Aggregatilineales bacterium]
MKTPVAIIILILMTTACNLLQSPEPDATAPVQIDTPQVNTPPPTQSNAPQPGYQLYIAEDYGIAFQYPEDWFLLDVSDEIKALNNGYTVTLASYDIMNAPGRDGVDPAQTKVDISIGTLNTMFGDDISLDDIESQQGINNDSGTEVLSSERRILPNGTEMLVTVIRSGYIPDATTLYTAIINGVAVNIGGFGDTIEVETIAMSLQAYP